jgi:phage shock protein A
MSANVNDLLDRAEDPVKMSAEFIRQANQELADVQHEVAMVIASYEDTKRAYNENEGDIVDWTRKAEMALKASRDDLARKALAEKTREQNENRDLESVLTEQKKQVDMLKEAADKLKRKIGEMEAQRNIWSRSTAPPSRARTSSRSRPTSGRAAPWRASTASRSAPRWR